MDDRSNQLLAALDEEINTLLGLKRQLGHLVAEHTGPAVLSCCQKETEIAIERMEAQTHVILRQVQNIARLHRCKQIAGRFN